MSFTAERKESGRDALGPEQSIEILSPFIFMPLSIIPFQVCARVTGQHSYKVMEQRRALQRQPLFRNQMQQMRFSLSATNCKSEIIGGADIV